MPLASLVFLTPSAALFALAVLLPLAAFAELRRRDRRVRGVLGIPAPGGRVAAVTAGALTFVPALFAAAATQPVLELGQVRSERTDAQAYVIFDTSRSMLASAGRAEPTRLQRSERIAGELRRRLPEIPVGIASFTDRVLPHLFPTADRNAYAATVSRSVGIEQPPPAGFYALQATRFSALATLGTRNFFSPSARRRVAVVFTDGESESAGLRAAGLLRQRGVRPLFVHVWSKDERVYGMGNKPEPDYRPDPASGPALRRFAAAAGGRVVREADVDGLVQAAADALGREGQLSRRSERQVALAPWITLAILVPLGFVLVRRNL
jgi:hypothetical protein